MKPVILMRVVACGNITTVSSAALSSEQMFICLCVKIKVFSKGLALLSSVIYQLLFPVVSE